MMKKGFALQAFFSLLLLFILFYPSFSHAQPLPPSKHILSYGDFVSSNAYAGEFLSVNGKVGRIEESKDLDWYRIELLPLGKKRFLNKGYVLVNHSVGFKIFEGGILTRDKDIGITIHTGDKYSDSREG